MIKCGHCGNANESFFKFCLKCGSDLSGAVAAQGPAPVKRPTPVAAPTPARPRPALVQDTVQDTAEMAREREAYMKEAVARDAPAKPAPRKPAPKAEPSKAARIDAPKPAARAAPQPEPKAEAPADTLPPTAKGPAPAPYAPEPAPAPLSSRPEAGMLTETAMEAPPKATSTRRCPGCGAPVETSHTFCGQCGYRFDAGPAPRGDTRAGPAAAHKPRATAKAHLIVINEDGTDGESHALFDGTNRIGRREGTVVFANDTFLSDHHADVIISGGTVTVVDRGSVNGTFVRITEPVLVEHGDTFRLGQELLRYEDIEKAEGAMHTRSDSTELVGAPVPEGVWGRLVQVMGPAINGNAWLLRGRFVTLGRERGDIKFPGDGYISGRHATLTRKNDQLFLEDMESSNGTYVRLKHEAAVYDGDLLLMGQQLFRLSI